MKDILQKRYDEERLRQILELAEEIEQDGKVVSRNKFAREYVNDNFPNIEFKLWDRNYQVVSREKIKRIAELDLSSEKEYESDVYDCDDYTGRFKYNTSFLYEVNSLGFVVSLDSAHAFNLVPFKDGSAKLLEPQEDRFVDPGGEMFQVEGETVIF